MRENPARPAPGLKLCDLSEVADPGARGFRFRNGEAQFAAFIVHREGRVFGYVDSCPHAGWPLAMVDDRYFNRTGRYLLCAGHGALFEPDSGACVAGPCSGERLEPWPVTVQNGAILTA